jgi:hypothetical protein
MGPIRATRSTRDFAGVYKLHPARLPGFQCSPSLIIEVMRQAPAEFEGPLTELYDEHLASVLPCIECVEQFDRWMAQYCAEPDPELVVRSVRGTVRRERYTTSDGTRFLAADNSPAWTVHAALMEQDLRTYADFRTLLAQMPMHMFDVKKQARQTANDFGWYVAHIARVKDGNTNYQAWNRREVVRRFYRTLHPCNLFFIPGSRNQQLGESPGVIRFVAARYSARYGPLWLRFCEAAGFDPEAEGSDSGSTIVKIGARSKSDQESAAWGPNLGQPAVRYAASRLKFKRDPIEALAWDESFEVATPMGTYRLTKRQFYEEFPSIPRSLSYKDRGSYHGQQLHLKAEKFRLREA